MGQWIHQIDNENMSDTVIKVDSFIHTFTVARDLEMELSQNIHEYIKTEVQHTKNEAAKIK